MKSAERKAERGVLEVLGRRTQIILSLTLIATVFAGILNYVGGGAVLTLVIAGIALALLAALVSTATEQLGERLGPGATGVLQSAIGNLPELFVAIFALRAGLLAVVQAALVGSILGNSLLVLGLAFFVGGIRHGVQRFNSEAPRMMGTLTMLAVAALIVPTLTSGLHTPAAGHEDVLSIACAVVLLIVFIASIPMSLSGGTPSLPPTDEPERSNAVEHVVGIQLAARNKPDYAVSVILNSSLQVALGLIPALVLLSFVIGGAHLTLVLPGLLVAALGLSALIGTVIVYDGESTWLEGLILIGLYGIIAMSFWWG